MATKATGSSKKAATKAARSVAKAEVVDTPEEVSDAVEAVEETAPVADAVVAQPTVVQAAATHKRARIKGTWRMYYNGVPYNFVDGENFEIPTDLYNYLRRHGNVYDTLA